MAKTVIITGAGASKKDGAPLMGNFLTVAKTISPKDGQDAADFKHVFDSVTLLGSRVKNPANVEDAFTIFESVSIAGFDNEAALGAMRWLIVRTLEGTMQFPNSGGKFSAPTTYTSFIQAIKPAVNDKRASLVTFNYDVGLDCAMQDAGIECQYGLNDGEQANLVKPHGSMNWIQCGRCWYVYAFYPINNLVHNNQLNLRFSLYNRICPNCSIGAGVASSLNVLPLVVPPTALKQRYKDVLHRIWTHFERLLREAERIVVIGYSMPPTDAHVKEVLTRTLKAATRLTDLKIFDCSKAAFDNFQVVLRDAGVDRRVSCEWLKGKFEDSIPDIGRLVCS